MSEVGDIPIYKLHKDYGFTEYEVRTAIEQFNNNPAGEYAWVGATLKFDGAKKPTVHFMEFVRLYHAMELKRLEDRKAKWLVKKVNNSKT